HLSEPFLCHDEEAQLVRRAEAVLHAPDDAVTTARVALEIAHRVDHVLEPPRARDRTLLRHVADEKCRDVVRLRDTNELCRALPALADGSRRGLERLAIERLYGIDHERRGRRAFELAEHRVDAGFREKLDRRVPAAEPSRPERDLVERFLARHVARRTFRREARERLEQQGRLADARVSAEEHDRSRHEPAAENAIELAEPARAALDAARGELVEPGQLDPPGVLRPLRPLAHGVGPGLDEGIPCAAVGALALPFR